MGKFIIIFMLIISTVGCKNNRIKVACITSDPSGNVIDKRTVFSFKKLPLQYKQYTSNYRVKFNFLETTIKKIISFGKLELSKTIIPLQEKLSQDNQNIRIRLLGILQAIQSDPCDRENIRSLSNYLMIIEQNTFELQKIDKYLKSKIKDNSINEEEYKNIQIEVSNTIKSLNSQIKEIIYLKGEKGEKGDKGEDGQKVEIKNQANKSNFEQLSPVHNVLSNHIFYTGIFNNILNMDQIIQLEKEIPQLKYLGSIYFESGSDILNDLAKNQILSLRNIIEKENISDVLLIGRTDNKRIIDNSVKTNHKDNFSLSQARAINTKQFLGFVFNINNIYTIGIGNYHTDHTHLTKTNNRRVDIFFTKS